MTHPYWPLFDLHITAPPLELRAECDDLLPRLLVLATEGIHDPSFMPFTHPWTDQEPGDLVRGGLQLYWRQRAEWRPESWHLAFIVLRDGEIVGTQSMSAVEFGRRRTVKSGSWLGRRFQGQGIGRQMRAAMLHFAFAGLGAERAESGAFHDNGASLGVSRALGYEPNGDDVALRRSAPDRIVRLVLSRSRWEQHRSATEIEIHGLAPCLPLFGLADAPKA